MSLSKINSMAFLQKYLLGRFSDRTTLWSGRIIPMVHLLYSCSFSRNGTAITSIASPLVRQSFHKIFVDQSLSVLVLGCM